MPLLGFRLVFGILFVWATQNRSFTDPMEQLFSLYSGWYYPVIWGLFHKPIVLRVVHFVSDVIGILEDPWNDFGGSPRWHSFFFSEITSYTVAYTVNYKIMDHNSTWHFFSMNHPFWRGNHSPFMLSAKTFAVMRCQHMTSFPGLTEAECLSITPHLSMQEICEGPGEKKSSGTIWDV